ncbi:MAG: cation diffusion facilitator family transporter [Firmicutes bacterium]|nr:cation diffusion facilitator family transporter [Bacillota bacterium]
MNEKTESVIIVKTSIKIMMINGFLAVIKIIAGIIGNSMAIISDAVNSISDVVTNVVVIISGKFSRKGKDHDHPYGHEKYESMVSMLLGVAILVTAFEIGREAVSVLYRYFVQGVDITEPKLVALIVALATILIKEFMFHFTKRNAKLAHSSALHAQALDHRGDELASFGVVIGIGGSMLGFVFLEPIASLVICLFVGRLGFKIIKDGISQVVDESAPVEILKEMKEIIRSNKEVLSIDELKTRQFGMKLYVDLEISLDGKLSLYEAHEIAEKVHDQIEEKMEDVIHCMIHVNPGKKSK